MKKRTRLLPDPGRQFDYYTWNQLAGALVTPIRGFLDYSKQEDPPYACVAPSGRKQLVFCLLALNSHRPNYGSHGSGLHQY